MENNNLHDVVIRNGKIIDGSGKKPFTGDIAVDNGKNIFSWNDKRFRQKGN